jgi:TrmH family RNA methyltransferase
MPFRIVELSSARNSLLKDIRQAAARGRPLDDGLLVVEGPHLLEEIARSSWKVEMLLLTRESFGSWESYARRHHIETVLIPARTFASLGATETTQGVMALARAHTWTWSDLDSPPALIVVLDGVQDPGNAGTIVRSAEAFGATGVVLLEHSVRLSNGKFIRASAGSLFRLPILHSVTRPEFVLRARAAGWRLAALDASGDTDLFNFRFQSNCALIVGSEGGGVSPELLENSTSVNIPASQVESLNAAVACSIALYEASRQRRKHEPVRG